MRSKREDHSNEEGYYQRMFASLFYRDYRYLWSSSFLSNIGTWMQITALSWLVYIFTKSALILGLVSFIYILPVFLFVLFTGLLADRFDRRRLLISVYALLMFVALALGILVSINRLTVFWIFVLAFATGLGTAIIIPVWLAIIPDVVPRRHVVNAVALNSAQFHGAKMIGSAIAGVILLLYGRSMNFYVNSASFLIVIFALFMTKPKPSIKQTEAAWTHLRKGFGYTKKHFSVGVLLVLAGLIAVFGSPFIVLLPIFAHEVHHKGPHGYGFMAAAAGFGGLVGTLTIANLPHAVKKNSLIKWIVGTLGISLTLFSISRDYYMALTMLVVIGWALLASTTTIYSLVEEIVPDEIRGQVMSIFSWFVYIPIGSLAYGMLAHVTITEAPLLVSGSILTATSLLLFVKRDLLERF